jgi:hypothetical protein
MAEHKGNGLEQSITAPPKFRTISRSAAITALVVCFVAGYMLAGWWSGATSDTRPPTQICARIDDVDSLFDGPEEVSKKVRDELEALVEQCRLALQDRNEEND